MLKERPADLRMITLEELKEHPENPRKHFDELAMTDLAASVRAQGVVVPLLVRPNGNGFEIISGHRRFRAARVAELTEVPAIVREMDDRVALELMVLDNLQRDDLHPLEEAEGYAALMKEAGYDVAQIARRIGRSEKYVYDRLKLLQLIPELQTVFLVGEISVGHAILLARLGATDQERANGSGSSYARFEGLWAHDNGHQDQEYGLELDDARRRKPVSVRELDTWINNHVRFDPEKEDLPALFPETAVALDAAEEEELKVIKITRDYQLKPETRGSGERTYSRRSWKRADGQPDQEPWERKKAPPSKECEHSVMGVVVAGPGRSDAFRVCIAKKKCKVHWAAEQKAANERGAPNGAGTIKARAAAQDERNRRFEEQRKAEEAERERWKKAAPALLEALAEKLKATPALELVDLMVERCTAWNAPKHPTQIERGETLDDGIRFAAFLALSQVLAGWHAPQQAPKIVKQYGIDAKKIVDQVAPAEKKAKAEKPKTKKKAQAKKKATKKGRRQKTAEA